MQSGSRWFSAERTRSREVIGHQAINSAALLSARPCQRGVDLGQDACSALRKAAMNLWPISVEEEPRTAKTPSYQSAKSAIVGEDDRAIAEPILKKSMKTQGNGFVTVLSLSLSMKSRIIILALTLCGAISGLAQGTIAWISPTIRNGSFEDGVLSPWAGNGIGVQSNSLFAAQGSWYAAWNGPAFPLAIQNVPANSRSG